MELDSRVFYRSPVLTTSTKPVPVGRKIVDTKKVRGPDSRLYTSVWPLVYLIRIFGLAPYEFHEDTLVSSSINSIYAYVCIVAYTYIMYTVLIRFEIGQSDGLVLDHTKMGKAVLNYLIAVLDILITLISKDKFVKIWNIMQDYDEIVKNLGYTRNETRTCVWAWFISCVNILMWMSVNLAGMSGFNEPWITNVTYMLVYIGSAVSVIKFSCLAMLLGQRFDHLNFIAKKSGPSAFRWLLASPIVDAKDIEYLHNMLMMASENLNSLYSWRLLFWLGSLSFHIVSDLYFVTQRLLLCSWTLQEWKILSCMISWISACTGQLMLLNYACHFASNQFARDWLLVKLCTLSLSSLGAFFNLTKSTLRSREERANCMGYIMINWRRWLKNSTISRRRYESVESSIHYLNRRLNFSAAGCFNVNLPLLRSISGLLTTYLVILLQFPE